MNRWLHGAQRFLPWRPRNAAEPSTAMFHRIRWRLTLWYSGVLGISLLIFAVVLYVGERRALLDPIDGQLQHQAQDAAQRCFGGFPVGPLREAFSLCYDTHGDVLAGNDLTRLAAPNFASTSIVTASRQSGTATDTVDGGVFGTIRRYAMTVTDTSGRPLGVVVVGAQVGSLVDALDTLLALLVAFGLLTLIFASAGGLFLANRALLPARLAYRRQRDFIADASHELRTPLTLLRADAEVLLRGKQHLAADDVELLQDVVMEASHMAALANNMLDLARLDADSAHIERDVVDLALVARDTARRVGSLATEKCVDIRVENALPVLVIGDRLLLEQVALVLLDNAIKYNHPGGQVVVRASTRGEEAYLEVEDTGIGIAPEHLPRLGERFYRVDKARSRETGGAGLGVSIAQRIASHHGGTLHLTSELGHGTRATLTLPLGRVRAGVSPS